MVIRIDQVKINFLEPGGPSLNGTAVQELLGGRFGDEIKAP